MYSKWGGGRLIERVAYLKFWLRVEGLIRERGLDRGGLNRAFTALIFLAVEMYIYIYTLKTNDGDMRRLKSGAWAI